MLWSLVGFMEDVQVLVPMRIGCFMIYLFYDWLNGAPSFSPLK